MMGMGKLTVMNVDHQGAFTSYFGPDEELTMNTLFKAEAGGVFQPIHHQLDVLKAISVLEAQWLDNGKGVLAAKFVFVFLQKRNSP
jgi:hypothetical protein